jgi:hypothetical protein
MALPRKRTGWCAGQIPGRPLRLSHSSGANLCGNFLRGATNNPEPRGTVNEGCGCEGVPNQPLGTRRRTASAFPPAPGLPFLFVSRECLAKSRLPDMHSPFERRIVETRKLARLFSMGRSTPRVPTACCSASASSGKTERRGIGRGASPSSTVSFDHSREAIRPISPGFRGPPDNLRRLRKIAALG